MISNFGEGLHVTFQQGCFNTKAATFNRDNPEVLLVDCTSKSKRNLQF